MTATRVAAHDRHLTGPGGETRVVHVRGHVREVPAWLLDTGPLPLLDRPSAAELPRLPDPEPGSSRVEVYAPRCPHGSFARWAVRNCCRPAAAEPADGGDGAGVCTGSTAAGDRCTRRTTYLDRAGRPACHQHGGRPAAAA